MLSGLSSLSAEETADVGASLGVLLKRRGSPVAVCLYGDLGAGKTTLIKGFASAFGISERDIGSASYVIVAEYETTPPFYHMDLYRLGKEACNEDTGIWEYIESDAIVVIEWAERLGETPEGAVSVRIDIIDGDRREISVDGISQDEAKVLIGALGTG
jgi:tRNA threonylcarbamoyladenosine biosynthesis protein TsaE